MWWYMAFVNSVRNAIRFVISFFSGSYMRKTLARTENASSVESFKFLLVEDMVLLRFNYGLHRQAGRVIWTCPEIPQVSEIHAVKGRKLHSESSPWRLLVMMYTRVGWKINRLNINSSKKVRKLKFDWSYLSYYHVFFIIIGINKKLV